MVAGLLARVHGMFTTRDNINSSRASIGANFGIR